jgi:hypothetical protein
MEKREERRDRTVRIGERRRRVHLSAAHPGGVVDCVCERSAWWFAKRRALGCDCRGRRRGAPKCGRGMCAGGAYGYRDAVRARIAAARDCRAWTREANAGFGDLSPATGVRPD